MGHQPSRRWRISLNHRILDRQEIDFVHALSLPLECDDEAIERSKEPGSEQLWISTPSLGLQSVSEEAEEEFLIGNSLEPAWHGLSSWSGSSAKRIFDCACVVLAAPLVLPLMLVIGAMVRLTSRGPVLFLQERVGRHCRIFKILKFRTMEHLRDAKHHPITTTDNQRFTSIGPFLRRWKLDELPQIVNVLLGDMSLIGPRPKLPEHMTSDLPCRPGITGMATLLFAREESALACVPKDRLKEYYHSLVLPRKQQLDADYMARATFLSDLQILFDSVVRRWGSAAFDNIVFVSSLAPRRDEKSMESSSADEMNRRTSLKHLAGRMEVSDYLAD